jgi:hypothetical protein
VSVDVSAEVLAVARRARSAARTLATAPRKVKDDALLAIADHPHRVDGVRVAPEPERRPPAPSR